MRKVKIVIETIDASGDKPMTRHSEVWSGELEILDKHEYLAKVSVIAEGEPQPLCDIPFMIGIGHYMWIPGEVEEEIVDDGYNYN